MEKPKAVAAEWKKKLVKELTLLIEKYKIIGLADMTGMPSMQLQKMRSSLKDSVLIRMAKGNLISIAINDAKIEGIKELEKYIHGMPALMLTNENPFSLAKTLKKSKSPAPAKAGQVAPSDIVIPAGPTPFGPGPIIGELGQLGIKAGIEGGKVAVKEDCTIVKKGEVITAPVAGILSRLNIQPMEIGINLTGVFENGMVFGSDVLEIDEKEYMDKITNAVNESFNLAFNIVYPIKENIELFIAKAYRDASSLADSQNIITSENIGRILGKANLEMEALKNKLNLPEIEEVKIEKKEEVKAEEKKKVEEKTEKPKEEDKSKEEFKKEEEAAQDVLNKLQEQKLQQGKT